MEWIEFNRKKNIKDKNNVRSNSEPNQQNRAIDQKQKLLETIKQSTRESFTILQSQTGKTIVVVINQ
jgi:hypothetical protein